MPSASTKPNSGNFQEFAPAVGTHAANSPRGTFGTVPVAALNESYLWIANAELGQNVLHGKGFCSARVSFWPDAVAPRAAW